MAIAAGAPGTYKERLRTHPLIYDYRLLHSIQAGAKKIFGEDKNQHYRDSRLRDRIIVKVFALLFSGRPVPGSRLLSMIKK
jgi:hypothetical protein